MQDDDKQQSYELLDETNPERNRRSFFDWLRGKEETDEEKLRKKLDEELKEAARKRATDFEEEQRAEEKREVSETKKLKKRWRLKLVEKSKRLLEEAAERGDEPTNGYEIAKLMVAERIVKLHEILTTEDLRKSEMKSLKIHIDFMGLLSEKLDRPELEVPEEVEELYQTIITSVTETTGETPPSTPTDTEPEAAPVSEADAAYTVFATSIVRAIRRAVQSQAVPELQGGDGGSTIDTNTPPQDPTINPPEAPRERRPTTEQAQQTRLAEQLLTIVRGAALSSEAIKQEISQTDHARKLADVAERAAMVDRFVRQEIKKDIHTVDTAGSDPGKIEPPHIDKKTSPTPEKSVEYMTELELITLAEKVQVPGGRFLSDIYIKGEIDREGLVKVLKSYTKGLDYRSELMLQRDKWQRHKEASPEYLSQPTPAQNPAPTSTSAQFPTPPPKKDSTKVQKKTTTAAQSPNANAEQPPVSTAQETAEAESELSKYRPTFGPGPIRRLKSLVRPSSLEGKLRNIGLSHNKPSSPGKDSSETQLLSTIKERMRRQSQVTLLLISMMLAVIIIVVVLEVSSL